MGLTKGINCLHIQSYHLPHFGIRKHQMEPYHIKHQHQDIPKHSKHSFANCYWLHKGTNTQYLHDKTEVLPMDTHLKLHATQCKQLTQTQTHPLHDLNASLNPPRNMKAMTISKQFHNNEHTNIIISEPDITPEECRENLKHIHTIITSQYLSFRKNNKVTNTTPYDIHHQNKHYHVICVQNWHSSAPTNHHSCKVTDIQ